MDGLSFTRILFDGLILSAGMSVIVIGSLYYNPRLWLQDYPPDVRTRVAPQTPAEKRQQAVVALAFFAFAIGVLVYSLAQLRAAYGGAVPFAAAYLHTFGVMSVFNLFDAVVLDAVLLAGLKPRFAILPGTEGMDHLWGTWQWHVVNFVKGIGFCAILSLPFALIASL